VRTLGYALTGAAEAMAEWVVEQQQADPDQAARRLVNVIWIGAGPLFAGQTWPGPAAS